MPFYADLEPSEAIAAARCDASAGLESAWSDLDRYLRWHLLTYLQERRGEAAKLRKALLAATDWAREMGRSPWLHHWPYLLEILRDGERLPAGALGLQKLQQPEGRAAQFLAALIDNEEPMRPGELAERLGLSPQQINNLARKLEDTGLIVRHKAKGRATWLFATLRGQQMASALQIPQATGALHKPHTEKGAEDLNFWSKAGQPVELFN